MIICFWALLHRHLYFLELMVFIFLGFANDVTRFLEHDSFQMCFFLSEITAVFCRAGNDQQAEQSNYLAEGQNPM